MNKSSNADKAVSIFKEGINCSQAVLSCFAEDFGIDKNTALKVAAGLVAEWEERDIVAGPLPAHTWSSA